MKFIWLNALALSLVACPAVQSQQKPAYQDVLIKDVPHVKQRPDFCGEACAEMYLRKLGHAVDQDSVFEQSGLDPKLGRGCYTADLVRALKKIGFSTGDVWRKIDAAKSAVELERSWKALHADLRRGIPSIVCTRYDEQPRTTEHLRLILGYDARTDEVIYHEPAVSGGAYKRMSRAMLYKLWPLKYQAQRWTVIRIRLAVEGRITPPARNRKGRFGPADYAQHVMQLKRKLPGKGFTIVVRPPFVVVGDEAPARVRRRAEGTVKWAATMLKQDYFKKDPTHILDVWLFKDRKSYLGNVKKLWGETPGTPFGYYSSTHRALIMNISTGGGTLVHELVHPFMEANFSNCPAWFNEGLASLYEQCGERKGHIHGYTNWRLAGLQKAIRAGNLPSFEKLTGTTDHGFYNQDRGTNYSQARYLCYYLQQQGLLVKFYQRFHANRKTDPSGYKSLKQVLGEKDMAAFSKRWQAWVLKLVFR